MNRPMLIILVGPPGSGKTHYANKYIAEHTNTIHLSSDKIRAELWGNEATQGDNNQVFYLMQTRTVEALNKWQNVVYDATNMTRKDRSSIIAACPKFATIEAHIVWATSETCIDRDAARERAVGKDVIDRMLKRFQAPYYDEGINEIKIIRPDDWDEQVCDAYKEELWANLNIPHDNPHHTLNIQDHCMEAARHILLHWRDDEDLIAAACWHDVGKPYVKAFIDVKGNQCAHAHYYQHQCYSAWLCYGVINNNDIVDAAWLVSSHMEPFFNTKYYQKLPAYLKEKLDKLHEADRAAH